MVASENEHDCITCRFQTKFVRAYLHRLSAISSCLGKGPACKFRNQLLFLFDKLSAEMLLVLLIVSYAIVLNGQGLQGVEDLANVGTSDTLKRFSAPYLASRSVQNVWKRRKASCVAGGASVCAPGEDTDGNIYSTLLIATSPTAYDSSNPSDTGGFSCIGPARDQSKCQTCTAMVAVGAAEAAVACVLRIDGSNVRLSEQDQYFCGPNSQRTCEVGWTITDAVKEVVSRGSKLLKQACLPYRPDPALVMTKQDLCKPKCKDVDPYASQGSFGYVPIGSYWSAQRHIRQYGSVITRMDINWNDFRSFFKQNPDGVYPGPKPGTLPDTAHAVICHGYNNDQEYWVCLNSWGPKFADQGSFRVKFGVCKMMEDGQTYGVTWTPKDNRKTAYVVKTIQGNKDCYTYTARPGDSISSVAIKMWGVPIDHPEKPLQRLLQDNRNVVTTLEDPIVGKILKICNPIASSITTPEQPVMDSEGRCTASKLTQFGLWFTGTGAVGPKSGQELRVANPDECCRLCAATEGCQFWWYMYYIHSLQCYMYGLSAGTVVIGEYNKARGGMLTSGASAIVAETDGCGPNAYILRNVQFITDPKRNPPVPGPISNPELFPTQQMSKLPSGVPKFVNGAKYKSWQACCQRARAYGLTYWTFGLDKRCWFKRRMPFNGEQAFEIKKAKGVISGIIGDFELI